MIHQNREYISKVKGSKAYNDKMCTSMLEDITREKTLWVDLTREDCEEDNAHKFLCLVKKEKKHNLMK